MAAAVRDLLMGRNQNGVSICVCLLRENNDAFMSVVRRLKKIKCAQREPFPAKFVAYTLKGAVVELRKVIRESRLIRDMWLPVKTVKGGPPDC